MLAKRWAGVLAVLVIGSMLLAACGPAPTPQVIKETVVVEKEETVVVEKEKVVTKEVEKVVTKEVEKEVIVEVTPTPVPGEDKVTLYWNLETEPPTLDPALTQDSVSVNCTENLELHGELVPGSDGPAPGDQRRGGGVGHGVVGLG